MYKKYYQFFLNANQGIQHYAAHSHHYWPDVTRAAMLQYWDDSARLIDDKWSYFFEDKIPAAQKLIAEILHLPKPEQIAFAPNTHEFIYRLFSCFDFKNKVKVLTTDSEFYSFDRQINRLSEHHSIEVDKVSTQDFATFEQRIIDQIKTNEYNLIFFSQVFYNSGVAVQNIEKIVESVNNPNTIIVIDGYHAFMAVPTDLSAIANRIFYIAGSYKYAQGGEGCCFMWVPPECRLRPVYTGWFAGFTEQSKNGSEVLYPDNGLRFAGSTMDFSALYRLLAVLELFKQENITVDKIHQFVQLMQINFINHLSEIRHPVLNEKNILRQNFNHHGHFFSFETHNAELTKKLHDDLRRKNIRTDFRGSRLRFGFGLYQKECVNLKNV